MKKHLKKVFAAALCCLLLFATACGGSSGSTSQSQAAAMGRYLEQVVPTPENCSQPMYLDKLPDGTLNLYGYSFDPNTLAGTFAGWTLAPGADKWAALDLPWVDQLGTFQISSFTLDKDKNPWFTYVDAPEMNLATGSAPSGEDGSMPEGAVPEDASSPAAESGSLATADSSSADESSLISDEDMQAMLNNEAMPVSVGTIKDGKFESLPVPLMVPSGFLDTLMVLDDGDLLGGAYNTLLRFDAKTGISKYTIQIQSRLLQSSYFVQDGILFVSNGNDLERYDLATGELQNKLEMQGEGFKPMNMMTDNEIMGMIGKQNSITPSSTQDSYYYANFTGIYQLLPNGDVSERIVDGSLNSMSMPSLEIWQLVAQTDDVFLLFFMDLKGQMQIYRYQYDANTPTTPSTELTAYTLEDNPTLRQAISLFQRSNPDVKVTLEVGYTPNSGITIEDAIKNLAARLASGNAPDILLLDGLPVESYQNRGVLTDLMPLLSDSVKQDLLENIAYSLKDNDKLFALPARYSVPMTLGGPGAAEHANTITDLVNFIKDHPSPQFGLDAESFIQYLYPLYGNQWFKDGQFQRDVFEKDLASLGTLAELYRNKDIANFGMYLTSGIIFYNQQTFPLFLAQVSSLEEMFGKYSLETAGSDAELSNFPATGDAMFTPKVLLGITETSKNKEMAGKFVNYMLSPEIQTFSLGDGLPVSKTAMANNQVKSGNNTASAMGAMYDNPFTPEMEDFVMLELNWPSDEFLKMANGMVTNVKTPILADRAIQQILTAETAEYLAGTKSLDDTMTALSQKLDLYLAENAR